MTNPTHHFDTQAFDDLAGLCSRFTGRRLQSPTRSTVPLLDLVYNSRAEWHRLLKGLTASPDCSVHFEFGVPSPKSGGNASQTDALFSSDTTVYTVEAKWTEPPDSQNVAKRISESESDGGDPRLTVDGWLAHLQPFAAGPLRIDELTDVVYQMIHRAASAAYVAGRRKLKPDLVYLHFVPSPDDRSATTEHYVAELTRLHERLGRPNSFPFRVIEMPLEATRAFDAIKDLDKHSPATSERVREALCGGPLFTFGAPIITGI